MTLTEIYLTAALVLVHLLGGWLMYAMAEEYLGRWLVKSNRHAFGLVVFLGWEFIVIYTIFTLTEPKEGHGR